MEPKRARLGTEMGPTRHRNGPDSAPKQARLGTNTGLTWHQNGPDLAPKRARLGTKMGPTRHRNGLNWHRNGPDSAPKRPRLRIETASSLGTETASSLDAASDLLPHLLVILFITSGERIAIYN